MAEALCQALPEFERWQADLSHIDLQAAAQRLYERQRGQPLAGLHPPGFIESASGAYLTIQRSALIEDEDGAVLTRGELLEHKATREAFNQRMRAGSRLSDALDLVWKQPEPLELRAVEELLRQLAEKIVPGVVVRFLPQQEPRFRAALRMEFATQPIPAAFGGVCQRWSGLPEGIGVASVTIHLESWAGVRGGQVIGFAEDAVFP